MSDIDAFRNASEKKRSNGSSDIEGIGGWLILPMIGLFLTPIAMLLVFLFERDALYALDTLTAFQRNLIVGEYVTRVILYLVMPFVLLLLMFNKRRSFPRVNIGWVVAIALFVALDLALAYLAFKRHWETSGEPFFDRETLRVIANAAWGVIIWVPYMLNSQRVKNTFVN
jgi:hypothetical protein